MKTFAAVAAIALASVATAQLENIPTCALNCFLTPLSSDGCQALDDFNCHCKQAESLFAAVIPCVQEACSAEDQAATISAVEETCKAAGVPVEVPAQPGASSSAGEASTVVQTTPTPTATVTPDTTVLDTTVQYTATVTPDTTVSVAPSSSVSGYPTPSGNGTQPSATPSVSEFPGAAPRATQAVGLLGAAALAYLAL